MYYTYEFVRQPKWMPDGRSECDWVHYSDSAQASAEW